MTNGSKPPTEKPAPSSGGDKGKGQDPKQSGQK